MRTTLVLDDTLVQQAKHLAVRKKISLSDLVNRALRQILTPQETPEEPPFSMVTFGPAESVVHHEPADFAELLAAEDGDSLEGNRA